MEKRKNRRAEEKNGKEKGNEERCGAEVKPGSGDHRSETGGRYIDIRISQVVIFLYPIIFFFSF